MHPQNAVMCVDFLRPIVQCIFYAANHLALRILVPRSHDTEIKAIPHCITSRSILMLPAKRATTVGGLPGHSVHWRLINQHSCKYTRASTSCEVAPVL